MNRTILAHNAVLFAALVLFAFGSEAKAQYTFFPSDAAINYVIPTEAYTGYASYSDYSRQTNTASPIVNLVSGGTINGNFNACGGSTVNITGGTVSGNLSVCNSSTVNVSGGTINGSLYVNDGGKINLFVNGASALLIDFNYYEAGRYYWEYTLTGRFASNHLFVQTGTGASFAFINASSVVSASGKIVLDGVADQSKTVTPVGSVSITLLKPGTGYDHPNPSVYFKTAAALKPGVSDPGLGNYTLPIVPFGTYDVAVKVHNRLTTILKSVSFTAGNTTLPQVTLLGGDAASDNKINFDDFLALINAFGSSMVAAGSGYDTNADFNYDGNVNFDDFLILLHNFDAKGDM